MYKNMVPKETTRHLKEIMKTLFPRVFRGALVMMDVQKVKFGQHCSSRAQYLVSA